MKRILFLIYYFLFVFLFNILSAVILMIIGGHSYTGAELGKMFYDTLGGWIFVIPLILVIWLAIKGKLPGISENKKKKLDSSMNKDSS